MTVKKYDEVEVKEFVTRSEMGLFSAAEAAECMRKLIAQKGTVNCVFAAAPSQNEFLAALASDSSIDWTKVNAFHMDEYVGFETGDSRSFSGFLKNAIFDKLPFKSVNLLNGMADPEKEAARYEALLKEFPTDIVFMGIGENGHIAFNDPSVAGFNDAKLVKVVELELSCRMQQVNDGCFPELAAVPEKAITVTIPGLLRAANVFCMVPNIRKATAVAAALTGEISEKCPASILRTKKGAKMYLDADSASKIGK